MSAIFGCINKDMQNKKVLEKLANSIIKSLNFKRWHIGEYTVEQRYSSFLGIAGLKLPDDLIINNKKYLITSTGKVFNKGNICEKFHIQDANLANFYQYAGIEFIKHINGQFAIAVIDKVKGELILVTDRFNSIPIFYSNISNGLIFASEIGALLEFISDLKLDRESLLEYFAFHFTLGNKTLFLNIKKLPPACIATYNPHSNLISVRKYWDIDIQDRKKEVPPEQLKHLYGEFKRLMSMAVEHRMRDEEKIGIFLSGGIDSRIIVGFANEIAKKNGKEVITFTIGVKDGIQQKIAKKVADRLRLKNIFFEVRPDTMKKYSEEIVRHACGIMDICDGHFLPFLEEIRELVDMVLLGSFGGELFGAMLHKVDSIEKIVKKYIAVKNLDQVFSESFMEDLKDAPVRNLINLINMICKNYSIIIEDAADYFELRIRCCNFIVPLFGYINWYIKTYFPFLDNEVVEFAVRLPKHLRRSRRFLEGALRFCFPQLSDIPLEKTAMPPGAHPLLVYLGKIRIIASERVRNFIDKAFGGSIRILPLYSKDYRQHYHWMRTYCKRFIEEILLSDKTLNRDIYKDNGIKRVLEEHISFKKNHTRLICELLTLELMLRTFIDNN